MIGYIIVNSIQHIHENRLVYLSYQNIKSRLLCVASTKNLGTDLIVLNN